MRRLIEATNPKSPAALRYVLLLLMLHAAKAPSAMAQQSDSIRACRQAEQFVRETAHASPNARVPGGELYERRQMARAQLLSCGATGGDLAAETIRALRTESDTNVLKTDIAPFANLRDAAVFEAAMDVAGDRSASEAARVFAVRTLWVQKTGKYWYGVDEFLTPDVESNRDHPWAVCGKFRRYTDAVPYWHDGRPLPSDYASQLEALATRIRAVAAEPMVVRAAVGCLLL